MTAAAALINRHDDPLLGGWIIELPHGEVDSMEPAHAHVINTQKNFRGDYSPLSNEHSSLTRRG